MIWRLYGLFISALWQETIGELIEYGGSACKEVYKKTKNKNLIIILIILFIVFNIVLFFIPFLGDNSVWMCFFEKVAKEWSKQKKR